MIVGGAGFFIGLAVTAVFLVFTAPLLGVVAAIILAIFVLALLSWFVLTPAWIVGEAIGILAAGGLYYFWQVFSALG